MNFPSGHFHCLMLSGDAEANMYLKISGKCRRSGLITIKKHSRILTELDGAQQPEHSSCD